MLLEIIDRQASCPRIREWTFFTVTGLVMFSCVVEIDGQDAQWKPGEVEFIRTIAYSELSVINGLVQLVPKIGASEICPVGRLRV
jgi:hypothetical protein